MTERVADLEPVRLSLGAQARHLRLARLTASGFATDLGFTVDEIEELRLAVDEACALLIERSPEGARLDLTYRTLDGAVVIECTCPTIDDAVPEVDPVSEAILRTTLDAFDLRDAGGSTTFRLVKRATMSPN